MLGLVTRPARLLDLWLHRHLGQPYRMLLASGLALAIIASATSLWGVWRAGASGLAAHTVRTVATVLLQLALLVNQLAQIEVQRARRHRRRNLGRDKARVAAEGAGR